MGYGLALVGRMVDCRIVDVKKVAVFIVVFLVLKLTLIRIPNTPQTILIVCLEIFPIVINYIVEKSNRQMFDSLHDSRNQLLKFKQILTEYLPNPMVIFDQVYESVNFQNHRFQKTFGEEEGNFKNIKSQLEAFTLDNEDVESSKDVLKLLGFETENSGVLISLSEIVEKICKQIDIAKTSDFPSFQVSGFLSKKTQVKFERRKTTTSLTQVPMASFSSRNPLKCTEEDPNHLEETPRFQNTQLNREKSEKSFESPETKFFKVKIFPLNWDGKEAIALIFDDVTHEKLFMELKLADKNKDLVIASISHELRTPINGMLGLIEIVKKKLAVDIDSEVFTYVEACRSSSLLLLNLVNSTLDFSQIKNNKLNLIYTRVRLADLLSELKPLFYNFCFIKNLYLNIEIENGVPETIITDRTRLSQILINLVGNAFKFTFSGGVTIHVERNNLNQLRVSVKDTGIGITEADQQKLFKLFGTIQQKDKRINTGGVGLGLTISNTLACMLNPYCGKGIGVQSESGKGSVFSFTLEIQPADLDDKIVENSMEYQPGSDAYMLHIDEYGGLGSPRGQITKYKQQDLSTALVRSEKHPSFKKKNLKNCLIVDDNPFNLLVATNLMQDRGYAVQTAMNGKEAVEVTRKCYNQRGYFDLILMDCQMPIMDGYEAARALRKLMASGELNECPIVALTANNRDEEHEKLWREAGMNGHLVKPLQIKELERILDHLQHPFTKDKQG